MSAWRTQQLPGYFACEATGLLSFFDTASEPSYVISIYLMTDKWTDSLR